MTVIFESNCRWLTLLFCTLFLSVGDRASCLNAQEPIVAQATEMWLGTVKTPQQWLRTLLRFSTKPDGTIEGVAVSLDQKMSAVPLSEINRADKKWSLELKASAAKFVGVESEDGNSVEGTFSQRGTDFAIKFERIEKLPPMPGKRVYRGELNAIVRKLQMQMRVIDGREARWQAVGVS